MMTILDIYEKYKIPSNLQRHQLEVAAVGEYVTKHLKGKLVNTKLITEALLLHDMGNIIKFKRPFLDELEPQAPYWEQVQADFIGKYGTDVHNATISIVKELGFQEVVQVLEDMKQVCTDANFPAPLEARICEYSDCCVTPNGIVGFDIRLADLVQRYGVTGTAYDLLVRNAQEVQGNSTKNLDLLKDLDFSAPVAHLRSYTFA